MNIKPITVADMHSISCLFDDQDRCILFELQSLKLVPQFRISSRLHNSEIGSSLEQAHLLRLDSKFRLQFFLN